MVEPTPEALSGPSVCGSSDTSPGPVRAGGSPRTGPTGCPAAALSRGRGGWIRGAARHLTPAGPGLQVPVSGH